MSRIGPYSLAVLRGRLLTASQPSLVTDRGTRPAPPRPSPAVLTSVEPAATHAAAWIQALLYRQAIGLIVDVVDDGDGYCAAAVIVDVRHRVDHATTGGATGGATLTTAWTLVPAITHGGIGQPILAPPDDPLAPSEPPPAPIVIPSAFDFAIAGYAVDAMTGDLQWWLPNEAARRVQRALLAIGYPDAGIGPSSASGSVTAWKNQAGYSDSFIAMDAMRLLCGTYANIRIAGIEVPCAIADATVDWQPGVGLPTGSTYLWSATLQASIDQGPNSEDDAAQPTECVVEVATTWGSWSRLVGAACDQASEGLCQSTGNASIRIDLSPTLRAGRIATAPDADYTGQWVRIRPISLDRATRGTILDPIWWGRILSSEITAGPGTVATNLLTAAGIGIALQQIELHRWWAVGQADDHDPGVILPQNHLPRGDAKIDLGLASHDAAGEDGTRWTCRKLLDRLVEYSNDHASGGPRWSLGGQTAALEFVEAWDLRGRTVLEQLAELIGPRRGLTFRLEIGTDGNGTIRVNSTVGTAINEAGLDLAIPVNDRIVFSNHPTTGAALTYLDLDRPETPAASLVKDRAAEVDELRIEGGYPWMMTTLAFLDDDTDADKYGLTKGWTEAEETAWDAATEEVRNSPRLAHVWRRFKLKDTYKGTGYFTPATNCVARVTRTTATDATHGTDGETGVITGTVAEATIPKGRNRRFTRELPIWVGRNWADPIYQSAVAELGAFDKQCQHPMVWTRSTTTLEYRAITDQYQIQVEDDAPAVVLGRGADDAQALHDLLDANSGHLELIITIGLLECQPWRVSWRRDPASRPASMPRSITLRHPDITYRGVAKNTMIGLTDSQTTIKADTDGQDVAVLGFGLPNAPEAARLDPLLRLARLWYDSPAWGLTWTRVGEIDAATGTAPGGLVKAVKIRLDKNRVMQPDISAVLTSRTWRFTRGDVATSYQAERLQIGGGWRMDVGAPPAAINFMAAAAGGYR
jgi:hypothetical protein